MNTLIFLVGKNPTTSNNEIAISLTDPRDEISNTHCKITYDGLNYVLEDLNSEKGTFVNNRQVLGKTIITADDKILLGPNYNFSILHPTIQSLINKTFFDGNAINNPVTKEKPKKEKFKMVITKKEAGTAAAYLIFSVLIDIYTLSINTNHKKGAIKESLLSFASLALFLLAFTILKKYFKSYKAKGIVTLINVYVYIGWFMNSFLLIGGLIDANGKSQDEDLIGIIGLIIFVIAVIFFIIDIILNVKFISFDKDNTNMLRPYGIISIIVGVIAFFVSILEIINNWDTNLPVTTIIEIIPTILLISFFIKLKNVYSLKDE